MITRQTEVKNPTGLHARPASDFVTEAKKYASKITIRNLNAEGTEAVNAKSIIRVLTLGMGQSSQVEIAAEGDDEAQAVHALITLIDGGFGEL
jgi:phosphocarrier protein HPr